MNCGARECRLQQRSVCAPRMLRMALGTRIHNNKACAPASQAFQRVASATADASKPESTSWSSLPLELQQQVLRELLRALCPIGPRADNHRDVDRSVLNEQLGALLLASRDTARALRQPLSILFNRAQCRLKDPKTTRKALDSNLSCSNLAPSSKIIAKHPLASHQSDCPTDASNEACAIFWASMHSIDSLLEQSSRVRREAAKLRSLCELLRFWLRRAR